MQTPFKTHWMLTLALTCIAVCAYAITWSFGWLTSEDSYHTVGNKAISSPEFWAGYRWCLTSLNLQQWIPIPLCVHRTLILLFGEVSWPHHVANTLLHGLCTGLLYQFWTRFSGRILAPFLAVLVFALHPQHVQLVAWISELKDLLAYSFALLTLLAYLPVAQGTRRGSIRRWFAIILLFTLGLSCRFIIAAVPLLLLLLHTYFRTWRQIAWARWSILFVLGVGFTLLAAYLQFPQRERFGVGDQGIAKELLRIPPNLLAYLKNTFVPIDLTFFNPYPKDSSWLLGGGCILSILLITGLLAILRQRLLLFGWLWHFTTLLPVCGLITLGPNFHSDHYSYLPHMGLIPVLFLSLEHRFKLPVIRIVTGSLATVFAASIFADLLPHYRDTATVMAREVKIQPDAHWVYIAAGELEDSDPAGALAGYQRALQIDPSHLRSRETLAIVLFNLGRIEEASEQARTVLRSDPESEAARLVLRRSNSTQF